MRVLFTAICLTALCAPAPEVMAQVDRNSSSYMVAQATGAAEAWTAIEKSEKAADFKAFIEAYPESFFAMLAKARLRELEFKGKSGAEFSKPTQARYERNLQPGNQFQDCDKCPEMVVVPPGSFVMPYSMAMRDDTSRNVDIPEPFAVSKFEITFDQWDACLSAGGCKGYRPGDRPDPEDFVSSSKEDWRRGLRPVINVSWSDAQAFVSWLSQVTGGTYRLLTEDEWEYSARANSEALFHNDASEDELCLYANHHDRAAREFYVNNLGFDDSGVSNLSCTDGAAQTSDVGSYSPNEFGLYDMLGNVSEWVEDCYFLRKIQNAAAAVDCTNAVLRGGYFLSSFEDLKSYGLSGAGKDVRDHFKGFRVAKTLVQ